MARAENVYIGRANIIRRELQVNGAEMTTQQKAAVTKVQVRIGTHCLDTTNIADPISYADGVVEMQLGLIPGLEASESEEALMIVYDAVYTQGKAWGSFPVVIKAWGAC